MAAGCEVHWAVPPEAEWLDWDALPLSDAEVARAVDAALRHGGDAERYVVVIFVDDRHLARMHAEYLGDPSETDVITFDLRDEGDAGVDSGPDAELYVSAERARRVAGERGVSFARELALYVVHGALHLVGYDDHDDAEREEMRRAERSVLRWLGYEDDR